MGAGSYNNVNVISMPSDDAESETKAGIASITKSLRRGIT